jgi:hypothetical protein
VYSKTGRRAAALLPVLYLPKTAFTLKKAFNHEVTRINTNKIRGLRQIE